MIYFHEVENGKNKLRVVAFEEDKDPDLVGVVKHQAYLKKHIREHKMNPVGAVLALVVDNTPEFEPLLLA